MSLLILHENETWCEPLAEELQALGVPHEFLHLEGLPAVDDDDTAGTGVLSGVRLILNRLSPSWKRRNHARSEYNARTLLALAEHFQIPALGGEYTVGIEFSKFRQHLLARRTELATPQTVLLNDAETAAQHVQRVFAPDQELIVKPDCGGSGFGVRRFKNTEGESTLLTDAVAQGPVIVQPYLGSTNREHVVYRYEFLDGELMYVLRIQPPSPDTFNNCPSDACAKACVIQKGAADKFRVLTDVPHPELVEPMRRFVAGARSFLCGIEVVEDNEGTPWVIDCNTVNTNYNKGSEKKAGVESAYKRISIALRNRLHSELGSLDQDGQVANTHSSAR